MDYCAAEPQVRTSRIIYSKEASNEYFLKKFRKKEKINNKLTIKCWRFIHYFNTNRLNLGSLLISVGLFFHFQQKD